MKLPESASRGYWHGNRLALAALLVGCNVSPVANHRDASLVAGLEAITEAPDGEELGEEENSQLPIAERECVETMMVQCDTHNHCTWQSSGIVITPSYYDRLGFLGRTTYTQRCKFIQNPGFSNWLRPGDTAYSFIHPEDISRTFSALPVLRNLWEHTIFTRLPDNGHAGGTWGRGPGMEGYFIVNVDVNTTPDQRELVVTHEMGHGIFATVLPPEDREEFTALLFELFDMVQLTPERRSLVRRIPMTDGIRLVSDARKNQAPALGLPTPHATATALYHEQIGLMTDTLRTHNLSIEDMARVMTSVTRVVGELDADSIATHKYHAMMYVLRLVTYLKEAMDDPVYDYLGQRSARETRFIEQEAYAYMFEGRGMLTALFARYFGPYLTYAGWQSRQYSPGVTSALLDFNIFLNTPEGRRELRRDFQQFWDILGKVNNRD